MKYLPWLILALPTLAVFLLWNYLPQQMPVHVSSRGVDRYGSREDFAALVMVVTAVFGLICYLAVQAMSSFSPISQRELENAYLGGSVGAAILGLAMLGVGWLTAI